MSPLSVGVALAVFAAVLLAVATRDPRTALVGLAIALVGSPFLADPLPPIPTLALRVIGGALAAYLLRSAVLATSDATDPHRAREGEDRDGSRAGWPTEALLALAAAVVGLNVALRLEALSPLGSSLSTGDLLASLDAAALSTGVGLTAIVMAVLPSLGSRSGFRTALGVLILIQGIVLIRVGVAGAPSDLEQLAGVALLVAAAVTGSLMVGLDARHGGSALPGRHPRARGTAQPRASTDARSDRTRRQPKPE